MWADYPEIVKDLELIEEAVKKAVASRNRLLSEIVKGLIEAGGKRIRPALTVISSKFGLGDNGSRVISLAGALEILHTATLVHDDVIDRSELRRGRLTVSEKYGLDMAVYTGDFLFTRAVLLLSRDIAADRLETVAEAVRTICEGEVEQYQGKYNLNTSVLSYLKRVNRKTAVLFGTSCGLGAYAADCPEVLSKKLARFGFYYGMAFQIRDDINDFTSDESSQGKPVGKDLAEGIMTLPVIYALGISPEVRKGLKYIYGKTLSSDMDEIKGIVDLVRGCGGVEQAGRVLKRYIDRGLEVLTSLPDNRYKPVLKELISGLEV